MLAFRDTVQRSRRVQRRAATLAGGSGASRASPGMGACSEAPHPQATPCPRPSASVSVAGGAGDPSGPAAPSGLGYLGILWRPPACSLWCNCSEISITTVQITGVGGAGRADLARAPRGRQTTVSGGQQEFGREASASHACHAPMTTARGQHHPGVLPQTSP